MIKVLIVDDSKVVQQFMIQLLSFDPDIQVVGVASSGKEAIKMVTDTQPDVITMDIHMPGMDGYEATRTIMEVFPTPIVIVTGFLQDDEVTNSFRLIESGALAIVPRPPWIDDPGFKEARRGLILTVKLMSEIKVVRHYPNQMKDKHRQARSQANVVQKRTDIQLIAIGASTGGPAVLNTILSNIPKDLPVPVLIVQHIAKEFMKGFRDWLSGSSNIPLHIAKHGELLKPGNGYIAPDGYQMGIVEGSKICLSTHPMENGMSPSIDFLFRSVAEVKGPNAVGILLTGMGKDGAIELKTLKERGAITIVQNEATSVIFGMPGEAVKIGAADYILSPEKIAEMITDLFK